MKCEVQIKRLLLFLVAAACLIGFDQWTKLLAVQGLRGGSGLPLLPGVLELVYVENRGAAFGMLQGAQLFFYLIALLVCGGVLYLLWRLPDRRHYLPMAVMGCLIFSGALGNIIDRLRQGYVVDFIYFVPINFPVFNLADIYVTVSAALLFLAFLTIYREENFSFLRRGL